MPGSKTSPEPAWQRRHTYPGQSQPGSSEGGPLKPPIPVNRRDLHENRDHPLMDAVNAINDRLRHGANRTAGAGVQVKKHEREVRQELRTPRYTPRWDGVPVARA